MSKENLFMKGATFGSVITIIIFGYILSVIAAWKLFEKAGESGWKSLIPIYNTYIYFKIADCTKNFWLIILLAFIEGFAQGLFKTGTSIYNIITLVFGIAILYFQIAFCENLSNKFGKGIGTTLGLFFFPGLFQLILGFGSAKYNKNK